MDIDTEQIETLAKTQSLLSVKASVGDLSIGGFNAKNLYLPIRDSESILPEIPMGFKITLLH